AVPVDEAFFAASEIKRLRAERPELHLRDFAIVLRSTTALGAPFEEALRALDLPYEVRGWGATARNEVVRFLIGYLESLRKPDDADAFESALASSLGGVGAMTVSRLRAYAWERNRPLKKVVDRVMYALVARDPERYPLPWAETAPTEVRREPDFMAYLTDEELDNLHGWAVARKTLVDQARRLPLASLAYSVLIEDGAMRRMLDLDLPADQRAEAIADLRAAIEGLESIEVVHERLHGAKPLLSDISGSLENLLAAAADDTEAASGFRDAVQVMTVHQAKGLEFEVVFCSGFAHGLFPLEARPHPLLDAEDRSWLERFKVGFMPSWPSDPDGHLAEEARLAFVAMTRARDRLHMTYANAYLKCPRLYWYNHHPGLVEEPRSVAMERGGFLHEVLQDFHEHEEEWRPGEAEQQRQWLEEALQRHLDGYLSRMEGVLDRKREEKQVRTLLGNYIRSITGMQFIRRLRTVAVEKRFRLRLDGSEVVGKIDRVNDVGDGEVEVVDYKTGSGKPMRFAYEMYFGPDLHDVQLALYYLACKDGIDEDGNPLGFQPRFLSLWYPKDWVWGGMRQDIFSVGRPAGLKEYREKPLTDEDLQR